MALTEAVAARGLRAQGINLDFAPVADVNSNPRNPVVADRSFGETPEGVAACVKHFPCLGLPVTDSHVGLPSLEADLARLEASSLKTSLGRVAALAAAYPARADSETARRAFVRVGDLELRGPLTFAAGRVQVSAASQATVSPIGDWADAFSDAGFPTTVLTYERATLAEKQDDLVACVAQAPGHVVFVSTGRTRMARAERE